ncbi:MAG: alanyl-tRNA editing protein [Candidatus Diapherotrites archaeon]|nr:alanyl-tRNA editing protein [Candidatus Diapherotrites archaeon]
MTEKIYLTDSYVKEFDATVTEITGNFVVLNKTAFYPSGGGQPSDTGKILCNGKEFEVISVKNSGENVLHELINAEGLSVGDKVKGILNWERRHALMKMHSAAHILSKIIFSETGALFTGNQLGEKESRMDFSVKEFDRELLNSFEEKANNAITQNLNVIVSFLERDEAFEIPELFRLKNVLPKEIPVFRIVSIGNFDVQADGGTHVKNTSEIGRIKITNLKNKGAENKRIYFELI